MRALLATALLLPLLGCGAPPPPLVTLPFDAVAGAGDPARAAILNTSYAFGTPARLAGQPAEAARAAANFEFLTIEIPHSPRFREFSGLLEGQLLEGRDELRTALGISPTARPQQVVDSLYAASRALTLNDVPAAERILSNPAVGGSPATLQRLAALPSLPRVNFAAANTAAELNRVFQVDKDRQGGGGIR